MRSTFIVGDCRSVLTFGEIAMTTFVQFRSKKFPPYEDEEDLIIPLILDRGEGSLGIR